MQTLDLKPSHAAVKKYYDALNQYGQLSISHEQAVKTAFHDLLVTCGRRFDWIPVPEYKFKGPKGTTLSADAGSRPSVTSFQELRQLLLQLQHVLGLTLPNDKYFPIAA